MEEKKEEKKKPGDTYEKPAIRLEKEIDAFAVTCYQSNYKVSSGAPDGFGGICTSLYS
jgi:hypothetical protein